MDTHAQPERSVTYGKRVDNGRLIEVYRTSDGELLGWGRLPTRDERSIINGAERDDER